MKWTLSRSAIAFAVSIALLIVGLQAFWEWNQYRREISDAEIQGLNLAKSLTQHAEDSFDLAAGMLLGLAERIEVGGTSRESIARMDNWIETALAEQPRVRGLFVYDANGDWIASSARPSVGAANNRDRAYFRRHAANPSRDTFVGDPIRSRSGGQWIITLSRRIDQPDGSFGGVVLASIDVAYFVEHYRRFELGQDGIVGLMRTDGQILARLPFSEKVPELRVDRNEFLSGLRMGTSGTRHYRSPLDGVERISGYQASTRYPFVLLAALGRSEVLAPWRRDAISRSAAVLFLVALVGVAGASIASQASKRQGAETALAASEANFRLLAENASDMVSRIGPDGRRMYVSPSCEALLGYRPDELVGRSFGDNVHPEDLKDVREQVRELWRGVRKAITVTFRTTRKDGAEIWVEASVHRARDPISGKAQGAVAVLRDVSERKRLEGRLIEMARSDRLTGLANRRAFDEALDEEWRRAARTGAPLALLLIDVDRFKAFNDTYGHRAGDECLAAIAGALGSSVGRPGELVARYGGEEMAVLLPGTDEQGAGLVAERMREAVHALQIRHGGSDLRVVTVSIGFVGIVPAPNDAAGAAALLEAADQALYAAKNAGRNRIVSAAEMLGGVMASFRAAARASSGTGT